MKWREAILILMIHIRLVFQKQLHRLEVVVDHRQIQSSVATIILSVHMRASGQQKVYHPHMLLSRVILR